MKTEKVTLIFAVVVIWIFIGCSSTRLITQNDGLILNKKAALVLNNDVKIGTKLINTHGDSIIASDYFFNRNLCFHFSDVQKAEVRNHNKGAWQGFLLLGGAAATVTAIATSVSGDNNNDALAAAAPFIWGIFGGAVGAMIGAAKGNTETYLFKDVDKTTDSSAK